MRLSTITLTLACSLIAACETPVTPPPSPVLGTSTQAIANGNIDTANAYPYVAQIRTPAGACSGELVTNTVILTANHCITGAKNISAPGGISATYDVVFDPQGLSSPTARHFEHTGDPSDPRTWARVRHTDPIGSEDGTDIALFELDEAVPFDIARPIQIGGFNGTNCDLKEYDLATIIGFGPTDWHLCAPAGVCPSGVSSGRSWTTQSGWEVVDTSSTEKYFSNSSIFTDGYYGLIPGDSGGALLRIHEGTPQGPSLIYGGPTVLCGINDSAMTVAVADTSRDAVLDSPGNHQFLLDNMFNSDGSWRGDCSVTSGGLLGTSGPGGGATFTIHGTGFDTTPGMMKVTFGEAAGTITCTDVGTCAVTTPAGDGNVAMSVTRRGRTCDAEAFPRIHYSPSVAAVTPAHGKAGDVVRVTGYLPTDSQITFGGVPAPSVRCTAYGDCSAVVPPGFGAVPVVATSGGVSSVPGPLFTYDLPAITRIEPPSGPVSGGTYVTIYGTGFDRDAAASGKMIVDFGGVRSTYVTCADTTWCTVRTPPSSGPGSVDVTTIVLGGAPSAAGTFRYVSSVLPIDLGVSRTMAGGQVISATVTLNGLAPPGGAEVHLGSSDPSAVVVPASVTVPAGAASTTFPVTEIAMSMTESVTLTAECGGTFVTAPLSIYPALAPAFTLDTSSVTGGASAVGTVTLTEPALPTDGVVTFSSSNPAVATAPSSITVAPGLASATVPITTYPVTTTQTATITAQYYAGTTTQTITVYPATSVRLDFADTSVVRGYPVIATVTLGAPAPAGGAVVTLTAANPKLAIVPATVTVPGGSMTATFTASAGITRTATRTRVTASYAGFSSVAGFWVTLY